jgi:hypothetical protein
MDVVIVDKADQVVALLDLNENRKQCIRLDFKGMNNMHQFVCSPSNTIQIQ